MRLMIEENDTALSKDKYILYARNNGPVTTEQFDDYDEAVRAYKSCRGAKFLYQPDKRYFLLTLSSTGFEYGRRKTVKAHGLFIAKNINQIRKFLTNDVDWRVSGGYSSDYSKFRIYTGGYGDDPICSDTDFERFNYYVCRELYSLFSYSDLEKDFGALDVNSPPSNLNRRELPFHKL